MLKRGSLLVILFLCSLSMQAQFLVSGTVLEKESKQPISGVSVYISNSSIGATTDAQGNFSLSLSAKDKVELIISHIAFKKQTLIVEPGKQQKLSIALLPVDNSVEEVLIKSAKRNPGDNYTRWGSLFRKLLLGETPYAAHCKIVNPQDVAFYYDNDDKELTVIMRKPLLIENKRLGYLLKLELETFKFSIATEIFALRYSVFFEPLKLSEANETLAKQWRLKAYMGSERHFMRAMFAGLLSEEGFTTYKYASVRNIKKENINKIVLDAIAARYASGGGDWPLEKLFPKKDTLDYYKLILRQPDVLAIDTTRLGPEKFLTRNATSVKFNFRDSLMVTYQTPATNLGATDRKRASRVSTKHYLPPPLETILFFVEPGGIEIDATGSYLASGLFSFGDMAGRRLAQQVPLDYKKGT